MLDHDYTYSDIAKMIDHSLLNPALTAADLDAGCALAAKYDTASVCILPYYAARCSELLRGTTVRTSTTIGFPHGGHRSSVKMFEAAQALRDGVAGFQQKVTLRSRRGRVYFSRISIHNSARFERSFCLRDFHSR